ncbi:MAG: FecR domain-containing protein [Proteobacteria bacterium]|nr:FecR domain-containing protein [Pseudomonadota bacterium]
MTPRTQEDFKVAEEAAQWLFRLKTEDTPATHAEFAAWVRKGAGNLQEFLFAQAIWREFDGIDPAVHAHFAASNDESDSSVVSLAAARVKASPPPSPPKQRRTLSWAAGLAACAALVAIFWIALSPKDSRIYTTDVGDQKAIKLSDGSVVNLNTQSKVEVRYSARQRIIRLIRGEALFAVEKDPERPFVVITDNARIRAVGTQFNVYRSSQSQTRVTVLDGVVQVSENEAAAKNAPVGADQTVRLAAGDEAEVGTSEGMGIVRNVVPNVQRSVAWRARRLVFPGTAVSDIANEFNRYNHLRIRVEGDALRQRRMSGVFDADDPTPLIKFLSADPNVIVTKTADEVLIQPRDALLPPH